MKPVRVFFKSVSKYFETCSLWVIFCVTYISALVIFLLMFNLMIDIKDVIILNVLIKLSFFLSFLFSCLSVLTVSRERKSSIFWNYLNDVETLINNSDTVDSLHNIFDNEIQKLWKISMGGIHNLEANRLVSLINIKIKTIEKLKP